MKIHGTALVKESESVLLDTDKGTLFIDNRKDSDTKGKVYVGLPRPDNGNIIKEIYQSIVKKDILEAEFTHHRNGFEHIEKLLKQTDTPLAPIPVPIEKKGEEKK